MGSWKDKRVEFIFGLPTTWQALSITTDFEKAMGCGRDTLNEHTAKLELIEAEWQQYISLLIQQSDL